MANALKLKKDYLQAMGGTDALVEQIQQNPGWSWAHNDENLGKLKGLHTQAVT